MTPLEIKTLLHIYGCAGEIEHQDAPAVRDTIAQFMNNDLITAARTCLVGHHPYSLTARGQAAVNALMALPLPVRRITYITTVPQGAGFDLDDSPARNCSDA